MSDETQGPDVLPEGVERRAIPAETAEMRLRDEDGKPTLEGYGAVFDSRSVPLPGPNGRMFTEIIREGAFDGALDGDVFAAFNHDPSTVFARQSNGRLSLEPDDRGVRYRATLNLEDPDAKRVYEKVKDGNVVGSSFTFRVPEDGDEWNREGGEWVREIHEIAEVGEMGPVVSPAYEGTVVSARTEKRAREVMDAPEMPESRQKRPTFDGTEDVTPEWADGEWGRPDLRDHPEAGDDEWDDLDAEARSAIAGRFIVGTAEADSYGELGYPVVNPATDNLNRNGLLAARQRASAEEDTEVAEIADGLWDEFYAEGGERKAGHGSYLEIRIPPLRDEDIEPWLEGTKEGMRTLVQKVCESRQSVNDLRELLRSAAEEAFGGEDIFVWVADILMDERAAIIERSEGGGESGLFRVSYEIDDGEVTFGETVEVRRVTTYQPVETDGGERSVDLERARRLQRQREAELKIG